MGEVTVVMNGNEFKTRHNDFQLRERRKKGEGDYRTTKEIELPAVPNDVLEKNTFEEQVDEMREYFKAWATSNVTHRNYVPYFRVSQSPNRA
jgi:hypothetical protein